MYIYTLLYLYEYIFQDSGELILRWCIFTLKSTFKVKFILEDKNLNNWQTT